MKATVEGVFSAWCRALAMLCLLCSWNAEATAPRVAPQLFGEEMKSDIVGYQLAPLANPVKSEEALVQELIAEAFKAAGKTVTLDVLPSRQLAKYALLNSDAVALMGSQGDLTAKEKSQYRVVTFYLRGAAPGEEAIALIFSKKHVRGKALQQAFDAGLQKIIKSGKYAELLEKHLVKGQDVAGYAMRLKRYNPGWK
ncbi:MAG: hypothetical protein HYZ46_04755 [Nitrosomonadales bacterium]|nr:hypothetical protein [Nitrosomonadales bacterium]